MKSEGTCDTSVCHGVCCTFVTQLEPQSISKDVERYLRLHGVELKSAGARGTWLKYPVPCQAFNPETYKCKVWDNRPNICRDYPRRKSPFIPKEQCSLLQWKLQHVSTS